METITAEYLRAEAWLMITTLIYFIMNGAGIFETAVIVPKWSANPPDSFQLFKGEYGIDLKWFWIAIHSIHEVTFIVAIVFCWNIPGVREALLLLFAIHFGVRVWTLVYFAPNIIEFQKIANGAEPTPDIKARAKRWRNLNYIRTGAFVAVAIGVCSILVKLVLG